MANQLAGWQLAPTQALRATMPWAWMDEAGAGSWWATPQAWAWSDTVAAPLVHPTDLIFGTRGDDHLVGTDGVDFINGLLGADTMAGAGGHDTYVVDNAGDVVVEEEGGGTDTVVSRIEYALAANVENLTLTGTADLRGMGNELDNVVAGNRGGNWLEGGSGKDTLFGGHGNDSLEGGAGADWLVGGQGDDTFNVDDPGDVTVERRDGGTDSVDSSVTWTLAPHVENLFLGYSVGVINGYGNALDNVMGGGTAANLIDGGAGNDTIGGGGDLSFYASDTLIGGAGDDSISGGGLFGDDLCYGGTGNDTLTGSNASLFGEAGNDYLQGGQRDGHHAPGNTVSGGAGRDTLLGGGGMDGGDGNDWIESNIFYSAVGGAGDDTISGWGGGGYYTNFTVDAGSGDDVIDVTSFSKLTLQAGSGDDKVDGHFMRSSSFDAGAGDDEVTVYGSAAETYTVLGGSGSDTIEAHAFGGLVDAGDGNDRVYAGAWMSGSSEGLGGQGDDTLAGTGGFVALVGGTGHDTFVLAAKEVLYESMLNIVDFKSSVDHANVSQATLAVGNGDMQVDGATTVDGPGGFDNSAELVIVAADLLDGLSLDAAAAAIGSANQAYAAGQSVVFAVDDGANSWLLYFQSSGTDAVVSAAELSIVGRLNGCAGIQVSDVAWGP